MPSFKHVKRGSVYDVLGVFEDMPKNIKEGDVQLCVLKDGRHFLAKAQISTEASNPWYLYVSREDGRAWLRPRKEFLDGRFVAHFVA